jgi:hypothetical protein
VKKVKNWMTCRASLALIYPKSKTIKNFERKKVDSFIKGGKIDFYYKIKVKVKNGVQI